ncbi:hypothetical protein ACLOJK_022437 [Asimina triloba]
MDGSRRVKIREERWEINEKTTIRGFMMQRRVRNEEMRKKEKLKKRKKMSRGRKRDGKRRGDIVYYCRQRLGKKMSGDEKKMLLAITEVIEKDDSWEGDDLQVAI